MLTGVVVGRGRLVGYPPGRGEQGLHRRVGEGTRHSGFWKQPRKNIQTFSYFFFFLFFSFSFSFFKLNLINGSLLKPVLIDHHKKIICTYYTFFENIFFRVPFCSFSTPNLDVHPHTCGTKLSNATQLNIKDTHTKSKLSGPRSTFLR